MARQRGDIVDAGRLVDESLPQLEAMSTAEPTEHNFATLLMKAWRLKAQIQSMVGAADAAGSAAKAAAVAEKLSRADGTTDDELGQCAKAFVVLGEITAKSGDAGEARRYWLRAAELLAPRMGASSDWRILDPAARAAEWLGRSTQARAMIESLNLLGYVPLDPWPDLDRAAAAKNPERQPK
jgi:hypothetical protein